MILKDGKFVHVGLTSFSLSDCSAPFPAVYSRTTYYLDWIMAAITNVPWLKTFNELLEFSYGSLVNKMILGKSSLSKNKNKYILLNQKKAHILDFFSSIWPIYRSKDTVKAALLYMISKFLVKWFFFQKILKFLYKITVCYFFQIGLGNFELYRSDYCLLIVKTRK